MKLELASKHTNRLGHITAYATIFSNVGKAYASNKFKNGNNAAVANFIGWGTGAGTAAIADTTLFTEAAEARAVGTQAQVTTTTTNDAYQTVGTLTSLSGQTITNAGVFDAASAGNMVLKADHTGLPLLTNDSIQYTFKLTFS